MTPSEILELAEKHWKYSAGLLKTVGHIPTELEHYLYVQSFMHGFKHGEKGKLK